MSVVPNLHSLFIKNLSYSLTSHEFLHIFEAFGAIALYNLQISKKGLAFLIYYDSRSAKAAVEKLQNLNFNGRRAVVDFATKIPSDVQVDQYLLNSKITLMPLNSIFNKNDQPLIRKKMEEFGEVKEVSSLSDCFRVEFYDTRSSKKAIQSGSIVINGISYIVHFENEQNQQLKMNLNNNCIYNNNNNYFLPNNNFYLPYMNNFYVPPPNNNNFYYQSNPINCSSYQIPSPQTRFNQIATPEELNALETLKQIVKAN